MPFSRPRLAAACAALALTLPLPASASAGFVFDPPADQGVDAVGAPRSLTVADLDRDGRRDIAVASGSFSAPGLPFERGETVSVLRGTGGGAFAVGPPVPAGTDARATEAGDLDGDGDLDLVTANVGPNGASAPGTLHAILNRPDGLVASQVASVGKLPNDLVLTDLNGDGVLDAAIAAGEPAFTVALGRGDGTFDPPATVSLPTNVGTPTGGLAAGRFDGDAHMDLAVLAYRSNQFLHVYPGNGDGTFGTPQVFIPQGSQGADGLYGATALEAADMSSDGRLDLVALDDGGEKVVVLRGRGDGSFHHAGRCALTGDLVTSCHFDGDEPDPIPLRVGAGPRDVATGDFDGDGDPDLAIAHGTARVTGATDTWEPVIAWTGSVTLLENDGGGELAAAGTVTVGNYPQDVVAADLSGDGTVDVATANWGGDSVSVILNRMQPPPPPLPAVGTLVVDSNWGTGHCARLKAKNVGTQTIDKLGFRFELAGTITQSWNGTFTRSGAQVSVALPSWAQKLAPGRTYQSTGYCATGAPPTADSLEVTGELVPASGSAKRVPLSGRRASR